MKEGNEIEEDGGKAMTLLESFFPPTPAGCSMTTEEQQAPTVQENPDLTVEEIEDAVRLAKPWKAPGVDGLPNMVWKET